MISEPTFEQEGDSGLLTLVTHFGIIYKIRCDKSPSEAFRVGGTAVTEASTYEGVLLTTPQNGKIPFRAFHIAGAFEDIGVLSPEQWDDADRHCYVTEYYPLDVEGSTPGWLISKKPLGDINPLFINIDVLDGGGNIMKRYRVSTFFGTVRVIE